MSKRSISKNFKKESTAREIYDWVIDKLPLDCSFQYGEILYLDRDIRLTINLDPNGKMSMIPEGPKIPTHHAKTRR